MACSSGKDRFKVNFVCFVEDVNIEVFLPQPLPWHHYLHCSWGKGGIFKFSWKACFYLFKVERRETCDSIASFFQHLKVLCIKQLSDLLYENVDLILEEN